MLAVDFKPKMLIIMG